MNSMPRAPTDPATLAPARLVDSDHSAVVAYARAHAQGGSDRERAVALYLAVRDGFCYDPYDCDLSDAGMQAISSRLEKPSGHPACASPEEWQT